MSLSASDFCDGVTRRGMIQAGLAGTIGLTWPQIRRLQAASTPEGASPPDTAVIYLELAGGPSQFETYDPKPLAPKEYRGPLGAVPTKLPGVAFCELMARQAQVADKVAVIRSIRHASSSHETSSHFTQTGYYLRRGSRSENDMPCIGSVTARLRGANAEGMPPFVSIPQTMRFGRSAWLGPGYNPFVTVASANAKNFQIPNLTLLGGLTAERLNDRRALLAGFDSTRRWADNDGAVEALDHFTRDAFDLVTGPRAREAFDISREKDSVRDRYGRDAMGQNMLLARRLVERGVTFVTVRANTSGSWDDHNRIAQRMRDKGPQYDQGLAALISDLHERGLDRRTLVVAMGEFGRTPRVNKTAGRDHWGAVMSVLLAGGGLKMGQVIGATDSKGAVPQSRPYGPENVLAVLYRHLGIDPASTLVDGSGRPRALLENRQLIAELD